MGSLAAVEWFAAAAAQALHGETYLISCSPSLLQCAAWRAAERGLPNQAVAALAAATAALRLQQLLHPGCTLAGGPCSAALAGALALLGMLLLALLVRSGLLGLCQLASALEGGSDGDSVVLCVASGGAAAAALYATVCTEVLGICTFTAIAAIEIAERRSPGRPWALQLLCLGRQDVAWLLLRLLAASFVLSVAVLAVGAAITASSALGTRLLQSNKP